MTFSKKNTFSTKPFRSGNRATVKRAPGPPAVLPSPPPLVGKIFSVFTVHRSLARECPLKAGGEGEGEGGQEAEPTLKIPRRCLLSPRCLAFSLFATVRSGQKRPALSSSSPSPSDSPRGRDEGGWRRRGTHRNANLYYPREREREIVASRRS